MQNFKVRLGVLVGIFFCFAAGVCWLECRNNAPESTVNIFEIPMMVGQWVGKDIAVEENVKNILETKSVLMREYINGDDKVWLAIVYYEDSHVSLHLPESCYTGQGSHIVERSSEKIAAEGINSFNANKLIVKGDKGNRVILYYFISGDINTNSYKTLRWDMMKNKIKAKRNSGALIRFSASIKDTTEKTTTLLKEFISEMAPVISEYLSN